MPTIRRQAKSTLTAVEMDEHDVLEFTLVSGRVVHIELIDTYAQLIRTTLKALKVAESANSRTEIRFGCRIRIDGQEHQLEREICTPRSLYEPWEFAGVRLWLDAVDSIFDYLLESHGPCRTAVQPHGKRRNQHKHARLALQDATLRICPEPIHPWCPLPEGGLRIEHCYGGQNCWLGAYRGAEAHGGLDIDHPPGTPLWAPIDLDCQFFFESLEMGHNNNRWRAIRNWGNGAHWILQTHHITELTVPEHTSLRAGEQFAVGAGVNCDKRPHSHFVFGIHDLGETIRIDPWILFWQMSADRPPEKGSH